MKSLMALLKSVLQDCSTYCDTNTTRDYLRISRRVEHEGISFLTISLGNFASDFEKSLELGFCGQSSFVGFTKNGNIPKLFSGMLLQVFNPAGKLLDEPSIAAIFCIRQICRMWKKILIDCKEDKNEAAIQGYIELERKMAMFSLDSVDDLSLEVFSRVSAILWSEVFPMKVVENLIPRHGPGVTATKVLPNQKYVWKEWHQRLESFFPSDAFCYSTAEAFLDGECSNLLYVAPEREQPVRVVFVPKTQKSPRVIAIEPSCMQYTQQSLLAVMVDRLESHMFTKGHINFSDQSVNRRLAKSSSLEGNLATLDLSEASDRVHYDLVKLMLRGTHLLDYVDACRSTRAILPNGVTIPLSKFASMGSALCFPIESMVFFTILVSSEILRRGLSPTRSSISLVKEMIYVYGDDLIIPVDAVSAATSLLETFGLKVNSSKSFSKGNFRESCGMDAYSGVEVTTIYMRRMLPSSRRDTSGLLSAVSLSNQLFKVGFFNSAAYIERFLRSWNLPYVSDRASCVGFVRDITPTVHRRNEQLHRPEVKGYVVVPSKQSDQISGYPALMKWFLQGLNPDKNHYLQSVGNGRLTVKRRWTVVN